MNKFAILALIIVFQLDVNGQSQVIFSESGLYGLKNSETQKVIIPAKYSSIHGVKDSLVIVSNNLKEMAIVNLHGKILYDYRKTLLLFNETKVGSCPYDTVNDLRLAECPYTNPKGGKNMHLFYIDAIGQCYPTDYNPCPAWRVQVLDSIDEDLRFIQLGENFRWLDDIDSAIICCKKAIEIDPTNPANYYWGAKLLVNNTQEGINSKNNNRYKNYFGWVESCILEAESIEQRYWYKLQILRLKRDFYKNSLNDKEVFKKAKEQIKTLKESCL